MAVKVTNQIKVIDNGWDNIYKDISKLDEAYTKYGYPENAPLKAGGDSKNMSEVAFIATIQEYGAKQKATPKQAAYLSSIGFPIAPGKTITNPARPTMGPSFDTNKENIAMLSKKAYSDVVDQKISPRKALAILGTFGEGTVKKAITDLKTPPNHPFTIMRKGSSNPLIDSGQTRASVTHVEVLK